jgi:hypothetical protein
MTEHFLCPSPRFEEPPASAVFGGGVLSSVDSAPDSGGVLSSVDPVSASDSDNLLSTICVCCPIKLEMFFFCIPSNCLVMMIDLLLHGLDENVASTAAGVFPLAGPKTLLLQPLLIHIDGATDDQQTFESFVRLAHAPVRMIPFSMSGAFLKVCNMCVNIHI